MKKGTYSEFPENLRKPKLRTENHVFNLPWKNSGRAFWGRRKKGEGPGSLALGGLGSHPSRRLVLQSQNAAEKKGG